MRTLSKLSSLVILVLILSIFFQHNPGICASGGEYHLTLYGKIAILAKGGIFLPATIIFIWNPANGGNFITVKLSISSDYYNKTSEYTGAINQITANLFITTTGNASIYVSSINFELRILQIPGDGISGVFTPTPPGRYPKKSCLSSPYAGPCVRPQGGTHGSPPTVRTRPALTDTGCKSA